MLVSTLIRQLDIHTPSPLQQIKPQWLHADTHQIYIKRDDLIHTIISGNKWRKLSNILQTLMVKQVSHVGSFGGGYSNHIHALAYCCHKLNISFTAFIRGNYTNNETPMLRDIAGWNANINYLTKVEYKQRQQAAFVQRLKDCHNIDDIIPEGGSHTDCLVGMGQLLDEIDSPFDTMILPVASGGTLAGLITHSGQVKQLTGIAVLKGQGYLESLVDNLIGNTPRITPYSINHAHHEGGYAKASDELKDFCIQASAELKIPFEPVYSGKVLLALKKMVEQQLFPPDSRICMLHTGGLQSARDPHL